MGIISGTPTISDLGQSLSDSCPVLYENQQSILLIRNSNPITNSFLTSAMFQMMLLGKGRVGRKLSSISQIPGK